jgi:predicted DNA-binding transcriptional regulator YafY
MPKVPEQIFVRPPWERMMHIHERLKSGKHPNCEKLARDIEVSTRTIKRDIDFMRCRLNLPIEYNSQRYGYYYSEPVEQFPGVPITEAETFALLVAHKAIAQYHGTPFQKPLAAAFRKLTGQLDSKTSYTLGNLDQALSFRPLAPDDTDLEIFEILTRGVRDRRVVRFLYKKLGARQFKRRTARPYHLACIDNHWYLFAFDLDRKDVRCFVLTRLKELELTSKTFEPPDDFQPDEYLRGTFTAFTGKHDYEVAVEFDAWATDLIRGRKWHASQEFTELSDGCSRLVMRLNSIEEMEGWVLGWGTHATVLRPGELVERIRKSASEISAKYKCALSL